MSEEKIIAFGIMVSLSLLFAWFTFAPKRWKHDHAGYGYPVELVGGDSFQQNWSCRFCDRELTQDSNGDYFHLSTKCL